VSNVRSASALLRFKEPESCAISCFLFIYLAPVLLVVFT
jgi:hypothetical protein